MGDDQEPKGDPSNWRVHTGKVRGDDFVLGVEGDGPTIGSHNPNGLWARMFMAHHRAQGETVRVWRRDRDGQSE